MLKATAAATYYSSCEALTVNIRNLVRYKIETHSDNTANISGSPRCIRQTVSVTCNEKKQRELTLIEGMTSSIATHLINRG